MARFLFCPVPEAGDVYPSVPVALSLRSRGHAVGYLTSSAFASDLRQEGFHCHVAPGGIYGTDASCPDSACESFRELPGQVANLRRVFEEFRADVLVDGAFPFSPRLFAECHGIPHASIHAGCFPIPTNDPLFPYGPGDPPPADEHGRLLARLANLVDDEQRRDEVIAWDAARVELGLPRSGVHPRRSAASPYLVLVASSPVLEYPRSDLPRHYWFTGPLTRHFRSVAMPESVGRLNDRDPIVYVSQGATYNQNPVILRLAFAALEREPVQVVGTVVRHFDPAEFEPLPANITLERFVPFSELVARLSLAITHGGAGAVQAALSHGVPVIVLPFTADQFEVAARCEWAGVGIRLDPWTCTPSQLREAVRTVLAEPGYRIKAQRVSESCSRLDGLEIAATLLEQLAATHQPVVRPWSARDPWDREIAA